MISRRSLFALFGGAVAAPLANVLPVEANPVPQAFDLAPGKWAKPDTMEIYTFYSGYDVLAVSPLVCENHRTMIWPDECDCGPGMLLKDV